MNLRLLREIPDGFQNQWGILLVDSKFQCYTLENLTKSIPVGKYKISFYQSPKNNRMVPLLNSVPNRSYIEIHIANYFYELEGCIAVGEYKTDKALMSSASAFNKLMLKIRNETDIHISVENG